MQTDHVKQTQIPSTPTIGEQKVRATESPAAGALAGVVRGMTRAVMSIGKSGISGTLAGMSEEFAGYPLDIVKTRMQVDAQAAKRGTFGVMKDIITQDGVRGLFRGLGPPLLASAAINSVVFSAYEKTLSQLQRQYILKSTTEESNSPLHSKSAVIPLQFYFVAGAAGGLASTIITCPVNKMQVMGLGHGAPQAEGTKVPGSMSVFRQVVRDGGLRGAYLGMVPTICRDLPGFGVYFITYEAIKRQFSTLTSNEESTHEESHGFGSIVVAGGTAGTLMHATTHPLDVIKSVYQTQPVENGKPLHYKNFMECTRKIYKSEGFGGFTRGLFPTCIRAFPASAIGFIVYEATLKLLPG
ncbi:mitochondrial substrate carrier family protein Y [Acrasis kona]|uniref:Mitochondrial substrate carrier family protein Y n=1 Tax=Acrasis kona TaxID=1008807 RepID=A0AAW2YYL0_9EUKA